jgi:hypothetical protein
MRDLLQELTTLIDGDTAAFEALPDLSALEAWLDTRSMLLAALVPALETAVAASPAWPAPARTTLADRLSMVEAGGSRLAYALAEGKRIVSSELATLRQWTAYSRYPVGSVPMHQRLDIRR